MPVGSIVSVILTSEGNSKELGNILLRTDMDENPFVEISTGISWGFNLFSYTFEQLDVKKIQLLV